MTLNSPLFLFLASLIYLGHVHNPLSQAYAETWCVAKPLASSVALENAGNYACSFADCSLLHNENTCLSSNLFIGASAAMNAYYQQEHDCKFAGYGIKSITDPSYGDCNFFVASKEMVPPPAMKWCIAKPSVPLSLLQMNIDIACSQVNCSVLQTGGDCQLDESIMNRASLAMNLFYQASDRTYASCFFDSTGMIVIDDPSHGTCIYGIKREEEGAHIPASIPSPPARVKTKREKFSVKLEVVVPVGSIVSLLLLCATCGRIRKCSQEKGSAAAPSQPQPRPHPRHPQSQSQPQPQPRRPDQSRPFCSFSIPCVVNICSSNFDA